MSIENLTEFCTQEYKEISLRTKELDKAKKILFAKMQEKNLEEVKSPFGRYIQYFRTTYEFPEDIQELKRTLTEAEERAKAEGRATEKKIPTYKFAELTKDDTEF